MNIEPCSPLVSVVVLNWNGLEDTKLCLDSIRKLDYPSIEIVVVDNGSSGEDKQYLAGLQDIKYVDNPTNRGFTGGHIDGLQHCKGQFIVLLNNDAVMQKSYLTRALRHFSDPAVAAVGGRSYWWNEENPPYNESNQFYSYQEIDAYSGEARTLSSDCGEIQEVNNISGSCVVVRRSAIDEVGYLYDRFFAYFEETDLFARLKRADYRVLYDPSLHIWHRNGASSGGSAGSYLFHYYLFRNRFIFAARNFERQFFLRFLSEYSKAAFNSLVKLLIHRGDAVMNKAYLLAAAYNLCTFPRSLYSRRKLSQQLGKSTYSQTLLSEQTGLSIVIDATGFTQDQLNLLVATLDTDTSPLQQEYILVTQESVHLSMESRRVRAVSDKRYFNVSPLNLGCIAARFPWMLLGSIQNLPDVTQAQARLRRALGQKKSLVAFVPATGTNYSVIIHKSLFQRMGGFGNGQLDRIVPTLITYADRTQALLRESSKHAGAAPVPRLVLDGASLTKKIKQDDHLIRSQQATLQRRGYQVGLLLDWLFTSSIPLRLKGSRLRRLALHSVQLQARSVSSELEQIQSEVLLYKTGDSHRGAQDQIIEAKLQTLPSAIESIPVFIICRDRVESLRALVRWLERHGLRKIVFIDNDSSYPLLLAYYAETPYQVIRLLRNVGHTSPWSLAIIRSLVPEDFYIVSDPDVMPAEDCPSDVVQHFLEIHKEFFACKKVGFGLRVDDIPEHYPLKQDVISWESQFWKSELRSGIYKADVDTTLALYKPFTYVHTLYPSIRTGEPYTARHLPWYVNPAEITEEEKYYRSRANQEVSSWNADTIKERYANELRRRKVKS